MTTSWPSRIVAGGASSGRRQAGGIAAVTAPAATPDATTKRSVITGAGRAASLAVAQYSAGRGAPGTEVALSAAWPHTENASGTDVPGMPSRSRPARAALTTRPYARRAVPVAT